MHLPLLLSLYVCWISVDLSQTQVFSRLGNLVSLFNCVSSGWLLNKRRARSRGEPTLFLSVIANWLKFILQEICFSFLTEIIVLLRSPIQKNEGCNHMKCTKVFNNVQEFSLSLHHCLLIFYLKVSYINYVLSNEQKRSTLLLHIN